MSSRALNSKKNADPQCAAPEARQWLRHSRSLLAAGMLAVVVAGCGRHAPAPKDEKKAEEPTLELAAADVAQAAPRALARTLQMSGTITPLLEATVKSKVSGNVLEVTVREGMSVHRGDVLVRVDTRNQQAQYDSQLATLEKARADLALAKLNRDNARALLKEQFISQNGYDSAENAYQAAVANEKLAAAQTRLAQIQVEDSVVQAPFDGVVSKRLVNPGGKVAPDSELIGLVDLSQLEFQASVPAAEIAEVHVGQRAEVHVSGFGERIFEGRVQRINPVAEQGSRSIPVYISVSNPDGVLRGGMFSQGELTLESSAPLPAVPTRALHQENGTNYVFVLKDGVVSKKTVELGLAAPGEGYTEIRGGLQDNDQVIVAKIEGLKDGAKAMVAGAAATTAATEVPAAATAGSAPSSAH